MISDKRQQQISYFKSNRVTWDVATYRKAIKELLAERKQLVAIVEEARKYKLLSHEFEKLYAVWKGS